MQEIEHQLQFVRAQRDSAMNDVAAMYAKERIAQAHIQSLNDQISLLTAENDALRLQLAAQAEAEAEAPIIIRDLC